MEDYISLFSRLSFDPVLFYETIIKNTDEYVFIGDMKTRDFLITENMAKDFGFEGIHVKEPIEEWCKRIHKDDLAYFKRSSKSFFKGRQKRYDTNFRVLNAKGEYIWIRCKGILKRCSENIPEVIVGVITNMGKKGFLDKITGLYTYDCCEIMVNHFLKDETERLSMLMVGMDDFSHINSVNNRIFGDIVLKKFATDVQKLIPLDAYMYRFDGDIFAILCPGYDMRETYRIYLAIQNYSRSTHLEGDSLYFFTVSGGIAEYTKGCGTFLDIVKHAQIAMVDAKASGKNRCSIFSHELMMKEMRSLSILDLLRRDIVNNFNNFSLCFQSFAEAGTQKILGAEALLRWRCTEYGEVSPTEFIPILENNNLISEVGKWVFSQAIRVCKSWLSYAPDFCININVSYLQLIHDDFLSYIRSQINNVDIDPAHIVIELTESRFMTNLELLKNTFSSLRQMNIKIAMDDFGTGYSSLGILSQAPADIIKIDKVFVKAVKENIFNQSFINAVIGLCRSIKIKVCVEGVEKDEDWQVINALNPDHVQGYYISLPLNENDFFKKYFLGIKREASHS